MTNTTTPLPRVSDQADERAARYVPGEWFDARTLDEMQAFYLSRLPAIREAAKEHGYAIGLHGSTRRDFDLIAMQWREGASDKDTLAHAIAVAACGITCDGAYQWEQKPNERFAVSMPVCWTDHANPDFDKPSVGHIDLSVIERAAEEEAAERKPPTLPEGWRIKPDKDDVIVIQKDGIGGVVLGPKYRRDEIAASIFEAFLRDLLDEQHHGITGGGK